MGVQGVVLDGQSTMPRSLICTMQHTRKASSTWPFAGTPIMSPYPPFSTLPIPLPPLLHRPLKLHGMHMCPSPPQHNDRPRPRPLANCHRHAHAHDKLWWPPKYRCSCYDLARHSCRLPDLLRREEMHAISHHHAFRPKIWQSPSSAPCQTRQVRRRHSPAVDSSSCSQPSDHMLLVLLGLPIYHLANLPQPPQALRTNTPSAVGVRLDIVDESCAGLVLREGVTARVLAEGDGSGLCGLLVGAGCVVDESAVAHGCGG